MEHNVIDDKNWDNKAYLRALKHDFDLIWLLYGNSTDKELKNENEIKVKKQMVQILESFFHD